eukprot:1098346_1
MMDPEKQPLGSHSDNEDDSNDNEEEIQISIKKLDGDTFFITISPTATVLGLKNIIHDTQNVAANLQRLIYRAQELKDDFPLSQYGKKIANTIHKVILHNITKNKNRQLLYRIKDKI